MGRPPESKPDPGARTSDERRAHQAGEVPTNFAVDSTVDAIDAAPGDGSCATSGGVCTLRAAIQEANALAGKDTVMVPAGTFAISIPFVDDFSDADGSFYLNSSVDLVGAGADLTILDGGMLDRVLQVSFDG